MQRTARWIENLPGGIKYLRQVILEDKLGICVDLERQMEELVSSFFFASGLKLLKVLSEGKSFSSLLIRRRMWWI